MVDIECGNMIVRVQKAEFKEHKFLDVRKYYKTDEGDYKPTRKGIALPFDIANEVADAIKKVNKE